jgi:hypothetical protein
VDVVGSIGAELSQIRRCLNDVTQRQSVAQVESIHVNDDGGYFRRLHSARGGWQQDQMTRAWLAIEYSKLTVKTDARGLLSVTWFGLRSSYQLPKDMVDLILNEELLQRTALHISRDYTVIYSCRGSAAWIMNAARMIEFQMQVT